METGTERRKLRVERVDRDNASNPKSTAMLPVTPITCSPG
jgi:hypothetical protein